jgi:hypothetical protein
MGSTWGRIRRIRRVGRVFVLRASTHGNQHSYLTTTPALLSHFTLPPAALFPLSLLPILTPHPFSSTRLNGSLTALSLPSNHSLSPLSLTALPHRSPSPLFLTACSRVRVFSHLVKDGDRGKKERPKRDRHNDTCRGDRITLRPHRLQDRTTRT